jgi:arylsulfatase
MINAQNFLLLSIDALRSDHLGYMGYHRETSPSLDRLAADNVTFMNAISPSSHTREAVPSLLTGRYPDEAVTDSYTLSAPTVPRYLDDATASAAFHSNPYVSRAYDYGDDFDLYHDDMRIGQNKFVVLFQRALDKLRNSHYARASTINDRSLAWVDKRDRPFLLWNHYMDVHGPYEAPEEYQRQFADDVVSPTRAQKLYRRSIRRPESISETERQTLLDLYDAEIRYLDDAVGRVLEALHEQGDREDTLVVITADHGEAFGEHGYYEHPRRLSDELLRVPLLLIHPDLDADSVSAPVSTLDLVPTVLDTVGATDHELPGESLWSILSDPEAHADRTVYAQARGEHDESSAVRFGAFTRTQRCTLVYDVETDEMVLDDSDCEEDLINRLEAHASERISSTTMSGGSDESAEEVNEAVEARLEALGYREER